MFLSSKLIPMLEIFVPDNYCRFYLPLFPSESTGAHLSLNSDLKFTQLGNNKFSIESNSSDSTDCCGLTGCGHDMDFLTTDQHRKQAAKTSKHSCVNTVNYKDSTKPQCDKYLSFFLLPSVWNSFPLGTYFLLCEVWWNVELNSFLEAEKKIRWLSFLLYLAAGTWVYEQPWLIQ